MNTVLIVDDSPINLTLIKALVLKLGECEPILFSEPLKWATGESNSVGAPGLIPLDRGIKLGQSGVGAVLGDAGAGDVASNAISTLPVAAAIPFLKGLQTELKEED